jgi:hypothetical protein
MNNQLQMHDATSYTLCVSLHVTRTFGGRCAPYSRQNYDQPYHETYIYKVYERKKQMHFEIS